MANDTLVPVIRDDDYQELTNEFEQIRSCLGMYISKEGTEGAMHLLKEIFNNAIDETVNPEALSKKIDITFDEIDQSFSITDYSRGIPFDKMVGVTTKKHTSTKFIRKGEKMKEQCGRNGVGITVTVALCDYFSMQSYRGNETKLIEFIDGKLTEHPVIKIKKPRYGLLVKFKPSSKYLKGEVSIDMAMTEDYLRRMSYIIPEDVSIKLYGLSKEAEIKDPNKWEPDVYRKYERQGLSENIKYLSNSLEFPPIDLLNITENFDLEVAFSYDRTLDECIINSYCNYVNTTEGGYHETVTQRAICDFFVREAKKLDQNSKYEVSFDDCKKGLLIAVNCKHVDPSYEGQHKSRVSNKDVLSDGKRGLTDALYKYFNNNISLLRRIISYLRQISKIRMESHRIRGITMKKQTTFLDDAMISGFHPISDRNFNGYTELIIGEGDSAGDSIDNCRNSKYQAVFCTLGVDNVYGLTVDQMMKRPAFRNLTNILGCGVGKDFDINKLKYSKIIMGADADTDGNSISSRVFAYIVTFFPELVLQGKIYKALPPLILLDSRVRKWYKGSLWLFNKEEYYDITNQIISENTEISLEYADDGSVVSLSKRETIKWLKLNSEYLMELNRLEKRTACNPTILEHICYYKILSAAERDDVRFKKMIEDRFKELSYDIGDKTLSGSYNGEFISIIIDSLFNRISVNLTKILANNPSLYVYCKNKNDKNDMHDKMTIGEFLALMDKTYNIRIEQRYKGLGEVDAEILFTTTLNPKVRKLVRFTIDDMKETIDTFELLHAKNDAMRQKRRDLLDNAKISYMDLDN